MMIDSKRTALVKVLGSERTFLCSGPQNTINAFLSNYYHHLRRHYNYCFWAPRLHCHPSAWPPLPGILKRPSAEIDHPRKNNYVNVTTPYEISFFFLLAFLFSFQVFFFLLFSVFTASSSFSCCCCWWWCSCLWQKKTRPNAVERV